MGFTTHTTIQDERTARDFIDNRSVHTVREAFGCDEVISVSLNPRSGIKTVPEPTDYSEKIETARRFLRSKGINQVKSVRSLIYGERNATA